MTKIQDLFAKPIERPIEGVIKADDERNLQNEVEEYVITAEVAKSLDDFVDRYLGEIITNGVWISGFFGSGKSHFVKILSYLLENRIVQKERPHLALNRNNCAHCYFKFATGGHKIYSWTLYFH